MLIPSWAMAQAGGAEPFDSAWILGQLERPVPAATPFLELRESDLLEAPLRIQGEYRRPDEGTLVREVHSPYAETTTLAEGRATIEREGRSPRSFSLSRAPELAGLQASFGALLAGDHAALEAAYAIGVYGAQDGWTMTMAPRDRALARRVQSISLFGAGDDLRCIETLTADDEVQRTLLGSAVQAASEDDAADGLLALCRGGAGG
ncbi:MAG: LolA-related protein [Luteimonas sp.]